MSSIRSVSPSKHQVTENDDFKLKTRTEKSGVVIYEIREEGNSYSFHNSEKKLSDIVIHGWNELTTSLKGNPAHVRIYAYFEDEIGQEKFCTVTITD